MSGRERKRKQNGLVDEHRLKQKVPVVGVPGRQSACSQCRRSLVVEASHLIPLAPLEKETVFDLHRFK